MKHNPFIPGWRTIKTAIAVVICFLVFLPWWGSALPETGGILDEIGPFHACVAAIICMQGSVAASLKQGLSRLFGTLVGGLVGLGAVSLAMLTQSEVVFTLIFCVSILLTIYICNLVRLPTACAIAAIVCCSIVLSHSDEGRFIYTLLRMAETAIGIIVAVVVNRILPGGGRQEEPQKEPASPEKN